MALLDSFSLMNDRVLVEPEALEEKTEGGITIPSTTQRVSTKGRVVRCGSGRILKDGTTASMEVRVGDRVIFEQYSGTEVELDGKLYVVVSEGSILGVFEK